MKDLKKQFTRAITKRRSRNITWMWVEAKWGKEVYAGFYDLLR